MLIRDSDFPGIKIESDPETHPDFPLQVNDALAKVNRGSSGGMLLGDFSTYSSKYQNHVVVRPANGAGNTGCKPELSDRDASKGKWDVLRSEGLADKSAQKRSFGRRGPGSNAGLYWAPEHGTEESVAMLSKDLIHARRIVKGTYTGGPRNGDVSDPRTPAAKEERRAMGVGEYSRKVPSQRSIVAEQTSAVTQGKNESRTRHDGKGTSTRAKLVTAIPVRTSRGIEPAFDGVSLSESHDPRISDLIGEKKYATIKVPVHIMDGLRLAEGVIHDVKTQCVKSAGNQAPDIHATDGWSYAVSRTARRNVGMGKAADLPSSMKAVEIIRHGSGTCELYGIVSYVLASERMRALKKEDPTNPLISLPLHRVRDSNRDHSFVVLGRRQGGGTGKFDGDAIIIDAWPSLAKPFLKKEASELMRNIDSAKSVEWSGDPCGPAAGFSLHAALQLPAVTEGEVMEYLQTIDAPQQRGEAMLRWVVQEHDKKNFIDDRITPVDDISTRYVDRNGRNAVFDHQNEGLLNSFLKAHQNADESGFLRYAR